MTAIRALTKVHASPRRVNVTDCLAVVESCRGNISAMARALGTSRNTVYRKIKRSPRLQAAIEAAREARIDTAESQLDAAVERGEPWAVSLTLRTIGRDRGYGDAAEVDLTGDVTINFGFAAESKENDE